MNAVHTQGYMLRTLRDWSLQNVFSYSLEGLAGDSDDIKKPPSNLETSSLSSKDPRRSPLASDEQGSSVLLTEEELEDEHGELRGFDRQVKAYFCSYLVNQGTPRISQVWISLLGLHFVFIINDRWPLLAQRPTKWKLKDSPGFASSKTA